MLKLLTATVVVLLSSSAYATTVTSRSGIRVQVSNGAYPALQCVVDYVEHAGVRITSMRGTGRGTVRASLHPSGNALDINQYARNRTRPHVPTSVSNAAADACGVISGARWGYADNGHWNLGNSERQTRYAGRKHKVRYAHRRVQHADASVAVDRHGLH